MKRTESQNLPAVVGEPPEEKKTPLFIFTHVVTVFLIFVTVIHCILVSISQYRLIFSGVSIILLIVLRKMKKVHGFLPVAGKTILAVADTFLLIGMCFLYLIPPFIFNSHSLWKYPLQKAYINCYQNIHEPDYFPDFSRDVVSDYTFNYAPSMMQGAGNYCVSFVTTPEKAGEYEKIYSAQAEYSFPLTELHHHSYELDSENFKSISVAVGSLWEESSFEEYVAEIHTNVYILSTNADWNHPHTSAVIVDAQSGRIEFSQLG